MVIFMESNMLFKILNLREERELHQKNLLNKYNNTLISYSLNIPGKEKDNLIIREIYKFFK